MKHIFKKRTKIICCLLFVVLAAGFGFSHWSTKSDAQAGTFSMKLSKSKVKLGKTLKLTIKINNDEPMQSIQGSIVYDPDLLQWQDHDSTFAAGSGGILTLSDTYAKGTSAATYVLEFQCLALGTGTITLNDTVINDFKDLSATEEGSPSVSYTIVENNGLDDDCSLSELTIGTGSLSPEWDEDTYDYEITVPKDTTIFAYSATPSCEEATVVSDGPQQLKDGTNIYKITVTAPSGDTQTYTLTVIR